MQKMAEAFKILISKGLEKITFPKISLKKKNSQHFRLKQEVNSVQSEPFHLQKRQLGLVGVEWKLVVFGFGC